jgi:hypothetical protein
MVSLAVSGTLIPIIQQRKTVNWTLRPFAVQESTQGEGRFSTIAKKHANEEECLLEARVGIEQVTRFKHRHLVQS